MKLSLEEIQSVLNENVKDSSLIDSVIKDLEKIVEEKKEEKAESQAPKLKNEFAIVILDEAGEFKDKSLTGYVVKYKQGGDAGMILSKLSEASKAFNETKKGKKTPLTSISEIFAHLKSKFIKAAGGGVIIQTKEPVRIIFSNNKMV